MKKILKQLKKKWIIVTVLFVVAGLLLYQQNAKTKAAALQKTYTVEKHMVKESQVYSGEVDASEKVSLKFQTGGRLAWVGVKEGQSVNKFQSIASLDQRSVRKELDKKLNTYARERADFDETQYDNKVVVDESVKRVLEQAQYDLTNSVIDVELQDLTIQFSSIYTPIGGVVTNLNFPNAGVNIGIADIIAEVVNPSTIYFSAIVDQVDLINIQEGMIGEISFDTYPDEKIPATIESISFSPKEDETGTVYEVRMSFIEDNSNFKYRLGMTGDVEFVLREIPETITVPNSFLKSEEGKYYVLKQESRKQVKTYVVRGSTFETETEITSGLKEGDVIVSEK